MAKPKPPKQNPANFTTPTQFRLKRETLDDLDAIAGSATEETGIPHTRTDAVRLAARKEADRIRRKSQGKT